MPYKVTYMFNVGAQGWSETFYTDATTPTSLLTQIPGNVNDLGNALLKLTLQPCFWIGTRISLVGTPRSTQLFLNPNLPKETGIYTSYPTNVALAICRGQGNVGIRQLWLHGVNSSDLQYQPLSDTFQVGGNLLGAFGNLQKILTNGNWKIRTVNAAKGDPTTTAILPGGLTSIGPGVNLGVSPAGAGPTKNIVVGGFKYPLQHLNGTYIGTTGYVDVAGSVLLLGKSLSTYQLASYPGGGTVRTQLFGYTPIAQANIEFVRERRLGRAFFVPRGRKSSR